MIQVHLLKPLAFVYLLGSACSLAYGNTQPKWQDNSWIPSADAPFILAERTLNVEISKSTGNPNRLIEYYKKLALGKPESPLDQFKWAYVAYYSPCPASSVLEDRLYGVPSLYSAMIHAKLPHSAEYSRLIFLTSPKDAGLCPIGEKLLNRFPNDHDVMYNLAIYYGYSIASTGSPAAEKRALIYAKELTAADPKNAKFWGVKPWIYFSSWAHYRRHKTAHGIRDANAAIGAYQEYIKHLPSSDPDIDAFRNYIRILQDWLAK